MENLEKMNAALLELCEKYGVSARGTIAVENGEPVLTCSCGRKTVLLPWRTERRFVELKNMLRNGTLEDLSTLRFCSVRHGGCLEQQTAKEFDLAVFFTGSPVKTVFAVAGAEKNSAVNIIAKLANDVSVSIECSVKLPENAEEIDRHELIAARGVASDRTVDTQVPQSSVYVFTDKGEEHYTDTDTELFGFDTDAILTIRAAFAVLSDASLSDEWNAAADAMKRCARAAAESDTQKKVICL